MMINILFILLQSLPTAEKILEINPYNALGYGLSLSILAYMSFIFYQQAKDAKDYAKELSKEMLQYNRDVLGVLVKVELRLQDQQQLVIGMQDIKTQITSLLKHSDEILSKIDKYTSK